MTSPEKRIFVVGPPGCGTKETTLKLSQHFDSTTVSVGDLLKKEVVKKTELGRQIEEFVAQRIYVPDSVVIELLQKYLASVGTDKHIFIEGFPKTLFQAKYLLGCGIVPDAVIFLKAPEDKIIQSTL